MKRKGGSAWITSNLWSRPRNPKFSTSQSRPLSRQTGFFECEYPLIDLTDSHNWARCCKRMAIRSGFETILATCCACSTKILLDSCSLSIEEAKERLCWQGVIICIDPMKNLPNNQLTPWVLWAIKRNSFLFISVESCQSLCHFFFNFRSQRLITIVPGKKNYKKRTT